MGIAYLPDAANGKKQGVDDYLAVGEGTVGDLETTGPFYLLAGTAFAGLLYLLAVRGRVAARARPEVPPGSLV